jgi:hypothetical protein
LEDSDPEPAISEIRCVNCGAMRPYYFISDWVCCNPHFTVPYELIWRSLPGGEDR